jgi:hypothetical protein
MAGDRKQHAAESREEAEARGQERNDVGVEGERSSKAPGQERRIGVEREKMVEFDFARCEKKREEGELLA